MVFGVLHFVPLKFPYPSRQGKQWAIYIAGICGLAMLGTILLYPNKNWVLGGILILGAIYFMVVSGLKK